MHKFIPSLCLVALLCFSCIARGKVTQPLNTVNELLWWFPPDIETLMVAKGPIRVTSTEPDKFIDFMQHISYSMVSAINNEKLKKQLEGQSLLLSIEGCRKFRSPKSLGGSFYEGCRVFIFNSEFPKIRDSIIKSLEAEAKEVLKIGEYRVSVFEEKLESDIWKFYLVSPKPDTLLLGTDQGFITDVLNRMKVKKETRALPDSLSEWKYVDTNAQFWAIRHYDINNATKDPTSPLTGRKAPANAPDKQAIGIVSMYELGGALRIRYLSSNKDAEKIQKDFWNLEAYEIQSETSFFESAVVQTTFSQENQDGYTFLRFLAAFGHAVYV